MLTRLISPGTIKSEWLLGTVASSATNEETKVFSNWQDKSLVELQLPIKAAEYKLHTFLKPSPPKQIGSVA